MLVTKLALARPAVPATKLRRDIVVFTLSSLATYPPERDRPKPAGRSGPAGSLPRRSPSSSAREEELLRHGRRRVRPRPGAGHARGHVAQPVRRDAEQVRREAH